MAGNLDTPGAPVASSAMPTTADIYNRLDSGAAIVVLGAFQETGCRTDDRHRSPSCRQAGLGAGHSRHCRWRLFMREDETRTLNILLADGETAADRAAFFRCANERYG